MSATATKSIKVPQELYRAARLERGTDGIVNRLSISSDVPYKRYDPWNDEEYWEVLGHGPGEVDETRLKNGWSHLFNHDRDAHIARATRYVNDGHRITLDIDGFIWANGEFAENKRKDIETGALPDTSVGYEILSDGVRIGEKEGLPVYKFRWCPHESSSVTIPADITVGAGRQRDIPKDETPREISIANANELQKEVDLMPEQVQTRSNQPAMIPLPSVRKFLEADKGGGSGGGASDTATPTQVDVNKERAEAVAEHKRRCKKIDEFVKGLRSETWRARVAPIAEKYKEGDADYDAFRAEALNQCTTDVQLDTPHRDEGSGVQVIGERVSHQRRLTVGEQLVRSKEFQARGGRTGQKRDIAVECDMSLIGIRGKVALAQRAGFNSADLSAVNIAPQQGIITLGVQRMTIMDLIAPGVTGAAALPYPRENSFTPAAEMVGERGRKPNWDPDLTSETANVRKVAVTTKVPDEMMADFPGIQSYIDERLPYQVDLKTEEQVLYGDGTGNNIKGILATEGVQARAYATSWADTCKKAITDIRVGSHFEPTGFAFHPYDWEVASLEKDANGQYYAGGPFYIPYGNGVTMEMYTYWGKPVVVTTSVTVTQPVVGAWKLGAQYFLREGMRLETTNSNEDDFMRNLMAIRAEHRLALAVYRPLAFLEITGGPARS